MHRPTTYYQICKVDHQNQELMVAEVEELHEAERLMKYLHNSSDEIYRVSKISD
jgi:hypothetical protein